MFSPAQGDLWMISPLRTLESQLKEIREQNDEMYAGQRGSRISKWIERSKTFLDQSGVAAPVRLKTLYCFTFASTVFHCFYV